MTPMRLLRVPEAFDHPEFVYEPKIVPKWRRRAAYAALLILLWARLASGQSVSAMVGGTLLAADNEADRTVPARSFEERSKRQQLKLEFGVKITSFDQRLGFSVEFLLPRTMTREHDGVLGAAFRFPVEFEVSRRDVVVSPIGHLRLFGVGPVVFDAIGGVSIIRTRDTVSWDESRAVVPSDAFGGMRPAVPGGNRAVTDARVGAVVGGDVIWRVRDRLRIAAPQTRFHVIHDEYLYSVGVFAEWNLVAKRTQGKQRGSG